MFLSPPQETLRTFSLSPWLRRHWSVLVNSRKRCTWGGEESTWWLSIKLFCFRKSEKIRAPGGKDKAWVSSLLDALTVCGSDFFQSFVINLMKSTPYCLWIHFFLLKSTDRDRQRELYFFTFIWVKSESTKTTLIFRAVNWLAQIVPGLCWAHHKPVWSQDTMVMRSPFT